MGDAEPDSGPALAFILEYLDSTSRRALAGWKQFERMVGGSDRRYAGEMSAFRGAAHSSPKYAEPRRSQGQERQSPCQKSISQ